MTKENETKITSDSKDKTPLITQLVYEKIAVIMVCDPEAVRDW